ncbi:16S rRNA (uracil(1498)-N(3))-methyltransferase [Nocardioides nitrophenolicus]|uniref:16S rRNA (uracil(1498)-N(3))-methyltransferase n=1 Tax=Nocardioides nitrophenolicus TaxID=60489 RepID=UPI001956A0AA|nr:16S rRNA (uracil(1498)-N(3))-methyltransferase [Nocardioides nitrophenolicus]MBM7519757.1 16S rRNA (uracil1498-N3)-methyltransferase [Nocardioides nitrophenolicus]
MTLPQHLVPSLDGVGVGSAVVVEGDEAHHAVVVRRLRVGERLLLADGLGRVATGEVSATTKRSFTALVTEVRDEPEPRPRVTVVQALPKGDRGELAVEVLTEIGAARIVPWAAARSVAVWKGERAAKSHAKWQATAREAAKQARRAWHPTVPPLATTDDVTALVGAADVAIVLHEDATEPIGALALPDDGELVVIVGPEGGLTEEEVATFVGRGAVAVRLGAEVLRTSTAGVAAVAAVLARTSRWGGLTS